MYEIGKLIATITIAQVFSTDPTSPIILWYVTMACAIIVLPMFFMCKRYYFLNPTQGELRNLSIG